MRPTRFRPALHRIVFISLAFAALLTAVPRARAQSWIAMAPFDGGNWTACATGPAGELYVISDRGTLHRSTDQGASWTNLTPNGALVTAVFPVSGSTVLAGMSIIGIDGDPPFIYLSGDGGNTWAEVASGVYGDPFVAFSSDGASTVFAITRTGVVWKSTDGGSSWNSIGNVPVGAPSVHDLLFDSQVSPSVLCAATESGLYTSPDGVSWSLVLAGPVVHLARDAAHSGDYASTPTTTYQLIDGPIKVADVGGSLCLLSDGSLLIGGMYNLVSGTVTPLPSPPAGTTNQVAVISGSTLLAATSQGVVRSTNNGQSWSDVALVTALQQTMIGAVGTSGVLAVVGDAAYVAQTPGAVVSRTSLFGPKMPFAAASIPGGAVAATRNVGVFFSTDNGQDWVVTSHDFSNADVLALARTTGGIIVVGEGADGAAPIVWSNDGGASWFESGTTFGDQLFGHQVTALAATGTTVFAASLPGGNPVVDFSRSTDGAQTWTILSSGQVPAPVTQLAAASTTQLYAISGGALYASNDGGLSWSTLLSSSYGVQSLVVDGKGNVWISEQLAPTVRVSSDRGATWAAEDVGTTGVTSLALAPSQDLFAGGLGGWHRPISPFCPNPGLVASWPAEGSADDVSGNYHYGFMQNGATFAAGKVGSAFSLDGVNDDVSVPDNAAFHFSKAMSIEGWIKTTAGIDRYIATKHEDSFYFAIGGGSVAPHMLSFWLNGISSSWFVGSTPVDDGQWHHVAATYDGSTMNLYVDGHLDASAPRAGTIQQGTSGVLIGARSDGTNASNFPGMIDELSVYNRAIGPAEVQALDALDAPCAAVSVGDAPTATRTLELSPPWPNPATRIMSFEFRTPGEAAAHAEIIDVAGRRVSQPLKEQFLSGGIHRFQWDGLDASGARAPAGVYLIRVTSGTATAVQRIVLVR